MNARTLAACATAVAFAGLAAPPHGDGVRPAPHGDKRGSDPVTYAGPTGRQALASPWFVRMDRVARGAALGWSRGRFAGRAVRLPFSPNARQIGSMRSFEGSVAWYRTTFTVGQPGAYAIRFESVNHRASVWVDGRLVGRHTGAYLPFEVRMRLDGGHHQLVVRSDWRDPQAMRAAGWYRLWFNFGGINREATIRRLGPSELDAPGIVTRLRDGVAVVVVTVRLRNRSRSRTLRVEGTLGETPLQFPAVHLASGATAVVTARTRISHPALWRPGHPVLHELRLSVPGESGYRARVGLRELRWSRRRLYLNGRPLRLRGMSLHEDARGRGDALLPADLDDIVSRLRSMYANVTRSQRPLHPALLERLDAAGIFVWQLVGPGDLPGEWTATTRERLQVAVQRARTTALAGRLHPSVLAWSLVNEIPGNGVNRAQRVYVARAAKALRGLDPGRPLALDVWGTHLPAAAGAVYRAIDIVGATNYEGWYANLFASRRSVNRRIRTWLQRLHRTFPDKPLVVTEFGAEGYVGNDTSGPGGFHFQARLLARHIRRYSRDRRLSGMLVWTLQDFALRPNYVGGSIREQTRRVKLRRGLNQKGLYTYGGRRKPAAWTVAELYLRAARTTPR